MKLKENSVLVYEYVKAHEAENITAKDIAEAVGLTSSQVNGIITMAFQRHKEEVNGEKVEIPLMERITGDPIINEKGKPAVIKYIKLTDAGRDIEVEAE